jgi:hypothetical protein
MKVLSPASLIASIVSAILIISPTCVVADEDDGYGMFAFQDDTDWSNHALMPRACISTSDGDEVVFDIYGKNHNQCKRKKTGTYKTSVFYFMKAYTKQMRQDAEKYGGEYEVDDEALEMLQCTQQYYNNAYFYVKVGCRTSTGKGFQLVTYKDAYCSEKTDTQYNLGYDISSLRVSFDMCKSCIGNSYGNQYGGNNNYNNYNNNNNNAYGNYGYGGGEYVYHRHESPLCAAAWNYKATCNGRCKRAAKKGSSSSSRGSSFSGDGFTPTGKFFLWFFSGTAVFFLLASLSQRKKLSKTDVAIEDAAIKSAGVDKKHIPRIVLAFALFFILLVLFKRKILVWFFLFAVNIALCWYWIRLRSRTEEAKQPKNETSDGDFHLYDGQSDSREMS